MTASTSRHCTGGAEHPLEPVGLPRIVDQQKREAARRTDAVRRHDLGRPDIATERTQSPSLALSRARSSDWEHPGTVAGRLAVSIWLVGDVRREVKAPRPAAS
jgi:hypothetical protein